MSAYFNKITSHKTCRTCLFMSDDIISTLETKSYHNLPFKDVIMSIANIQISEKDGLTAFVCDKCVVDAEGAYDFKIRCEASDTALRTKAETITLDVPIVAREEEEEKKEGYGNKECDVKQEMPDIKIDPYMSDEYQNNTSDDDDDADYTPLDELKPEDEEDELLDIKPDRSLSSRRSISSASKRSIGLASKRSIGSASKRSISLASKRSIGSASKRSIGLASRKTISSVSKNTIICETVKDEKVAVESSTDLTKSRKKIAHVCQFCNAIFRSGLVHRKHVKRVHGMEYVLPKAGAPPADGMQDTDGDIEGETFSGYKCGECEFTTETFGVFKKHALLHTGNKPISCDECNYRCVDIGYLVKHKKKHTGERPYACEKCSYRAAKPYSLKTHMATHSEEKPYACQQCPFTCKVSSGLIHHVARCHEGRKNHVCLTCDKRFFTMTHLKEHQTVHSGERPYICEKCGIAYAQKWSLTQHVASVHAPEGEIVPSRRKFACKLCDYTAKANKTLRIHMYKHTGEKPAVCDLCDFKSTSDNALKLHKQRHAGDARFTCDSCPYKCYSNDRLKAHKRCHTGEKPFVCPKCDFRASTSGGLHKHSKMHTNEQAYACPNCPYTANYKYNLTKHQRERCGKTRKYNAASRRLKARARAAMLCYAHDEESKPAIDDVVGESSAN